MAKSGIDWGELGDDFLKAAVEYYRQQQASKAPNFTPQPLTPEDKYWDDARKKMFESGGSPEMKAVQGAGASFLSQMPQGPTDFKFMSPLLQGQSFSGGVKIPKFDFSAFNPGASQAAPPPAQQGRVRNDTFQGGPPNGAGRDPFIRDIPGDIGGGGPAYGETIGDYYTRNPGGRLGEGEFPTTGGPNDPNKPNKPPGFIGPPLPGETRYGQGNPIGAVWDGFQEFKAAHPNWTQLGVNAIAGALAATLGLPGALVGKILQSILNGKTQPPTPTPDPTKKP